MSADDQTWDVIVIGAGAAGLLSAASAAVRGRRTLILEKNRKPGAKILMSGGTRCNITHNCDAAGIAAAFGPQGRFLRSALAALSPQDVVDLVERLGVPTKTECTGKVFPVSNRAVDVRDALLRHARQCGAELRVEQPVLNLRPDDHPKRDDAADGTDCRLSVDTDRGSFRAHSVILTTGGRSWPGCGTTGDGYAWARRLGHTIAPTVPALTPIVSHAEWVTSLQGITLEDVRLQVVTAAAAAGQAKLKPLAGGQGPLLLTHFGVSGPTAMNLSRVITLSEQRGGGPNENLALLCDFWPEVSEEDLQQQFQEARSRAGKKPVGTLFSAFPRRLVEALLMESGIAVDQRLADLPRTGQRRLIAQVKRAVIPIHGTLGYQKAEVTAGGVSLKDVDSRTLQSRHVPGLFFAGEILDVDGPIGGFNFQAAFSTGWLAGQHA